MSTARSQNQDRWDHQLLGTLVGEQKKSQVSNEYASYLIRSNYEGPVNILSLFANVFEDRGSGTIIGISSVAGIRGRASNYFYGSAKSGFISFLSGLNGNSNVSLLSG